MPEATVVKVLSSQLDGADLRSRKRGYYLRCDGKEDDAEIQDAIVSKLRNIWSIPGSAWERIFRGKENG